MREKITEYFIVGGGLSGSCLGYLLRKGGKDVLVAEIADTKKKDKLCGGILNGVAWADFDKIFSADGKKVLRALPVSTLKSRLGKCETIRHVDFWTVPRKRLDDYVLRQYKDAKGELMDMVSVRKIDAGKGIAECIDLRSKEIFTVRFSQIIGADGAISRTRQLVTHKKPDALMAFEAEIGKDGEDMVFDYLFGTVGYNWYIPQEDRAMVGSFFQDVSAVTCRQYFDDFMVTVAPLSFSSVKVRGAFIPTGQDVCLKVKDNVYFMGDAAGLVHGADGGGIMYALISARLLAESLLSREDYEKLMQPCVSEVAFSVANKTKQQFLNNMMIMKKTQIIQQ